MTFCISVILPIILVKTHSLFETAYNNVSQQLIKGFLLKDEMA